MVEANSHQSDSPELCFPGPVLSTLGRRVGVVTLGAAGEEGPEEEKGKAADSGARVPGGPVRLLGEEEVGWEGERSAGVWMWACEAGVA